MAFGKLRVDQIETSTQTVSVDAVIAIGADGDKGDITVSGAGTVWTIDDGAVDTAALGGDITAAGKALLDDADAAAQRTTLGAEAAGTAASAISAHEAAADPHPGYALESSLATVATTGAYSDLTGTPALVANLDDLGDVDLTTTPPADGEGLVYDSATGNWVPGAAGATAAGSANQIQYNDGSSGLAASADLTWDDTGKVLGVGGDVDLDDGGTYTTTLQTITATANRTISLPDATGTVALVAGSSGQLIYNNAGANAGVSSAIVGSGGDITLSANGAASTSYGSAFKLTGSWFVGANPVPQALIQPAGTTSTAWSTSGTGLGVNAASGFAGRLIDLQVNGTSYFQIVPGSNSSSLRLFGSSGWDNFIRSKSTAGTGFNIETNLGLVGRLEFGVGSGTTGAGDTFILRDAAGILAQRNGTNAQTYRLYNTYTSETSFERAKLSWNTNVLEVGTEKGGDGGTARDMVLQTDGTTRITLKADGAILFSGLPTSDPAVAGQLWNDGNTLKISAG